MQGERQRGPEAAMPPALRWRHHTEFISAPSASGRAIASGTSATSGRESGNAQKRAALNENSTTSSAGPNRKAKMAARYSAPQYRCDASSKRPGAQSPPRLLSIPRQRPAPQAGSPIMPHPTPSSTHRRAAKRSLCRTSSRLCLPPVAAPTNVPDIGINTKISPAMMPGMLNGSTILAKVRSSPAPSERAASTMLQSRRSSDM